MSAKGTTWSNHKYIAIKNGRYIYPDDPAFGFRGRSARRAIGAKMQKSLKDKNKRVQTYDWSPIGKAGSSGSKKGRSGGGGSKEKEKKEKEKKETKSNQKDLSKLMEKVIDSLSDETLKKLNLSDENNVKYLMATYMRVNPETVDRSIVQGLVAKLKAKSIKHSEMGQEYLAHFGILGMKWGKRNGPPYPLSKLISTGRRLKKQRKEKKEVAREVRDSEDAKSLYKHRRNYTTEQIQEKLKRIKVLDELKSMKEKRVNSLKRKMDIINGYTGSFGTGIGNINKILTNLNNYTTRKDKELTAQLVRDKSKTESQAAIDRIKEEREFESLTKEIEKLRSEKKTLDKKIKQANSVLDQVKNKKKD